MGGATGGASGPSSLCRGRRGLRLVAAAGSVVAQTLRPRWFWGKPAAGDARGASGLCQCGVARTVRVHRTGIFPRQVCKSAAPPRGL